MLVSTMSVPVVAADNAACRDHPGQWNRWSGQILDGPKHGAAAVLEAQNLQMCFGEVWGLEISGSFAWVNIEGPRSNDIVQIGIGKCRYPGVADCTWEMMIYRGWGRTRISPGCEDFQSVPPQAFKVANWDGAAHNFKVYHQNNWWRLFKDAQEVLAIQERDICWTPRDAAWFGESLDIGDAIGGSRNDKYRITDMNYANAENGGFFWTNYDASRPCNLGPGNPQPNGPPFFCDVTSTRNMSIWTDR